MPDEYVERIIEQKLGLKNIKVFTQGPLDLVLSKLGRGSGKDIEDCCYLIRGNKVNVRKLIEAYQDWQTDYVGDPKRLEGVLLYILDRCEIDYEEAKKGL